MAAKKSKTLEEIQTVTLNMTETKELLKYQFKQVISCGAKFHGLMYFIEGEPGIGKTQMQSQVLKETMEEIKKEFAKELKDSPDFKYFMKEQDGNGHLEVMNLCAKDAQDFTGLPYIEDETKTQKFAHPDNLPQRGYGIIFYDEANRVMDMSMKATLLSLWMDRGVNGHYLGNGYLQVAAGNPFNDPAFETEKPDRALAERFRIIRLVPTFEEVMKFFEAKYGNHFLIDFLKENGDICTLVNGAEGSFSPRLLDKAMELTYSLKENPQSKLTLVRMILSTYFGQSVSTRIVNFLTQQAEVNFARILQNPKLSKKVKKTDMPLMGRLSEEMFRYIDDKVTKNESLSEEEKTAIDVTCAAINSEAKGVFLNKILETANDKDFIAYLQKNHKKLLVELKPVAEKF